MKHIIPKIKGKWLVFYPKHRVRIWNFIDVLGLSLCFSLYLLYKYNTSVLFTFFVGVAIYFIYKEIVGDLILIFKNFKR